MTVPPPAERKCNRLAQESSPYLRQHMFNPVDWYPWGEPALQRARDLNRPILLSVGYSACHWCHVMEHESFEDAATAALMNDHFVPIKVDREERPDVDHIYMAACQLFTGAGGWPLTVFLTPDLRPFFAGTYFPPEPRYGKPGFKTVLGALHQAYTTQRSTVDTQAAEFLETLTQVLTHTPIDTPAAPAIPTPKIISTASQKVLLKFDWNHGGWGHAPKFPHTQELLLLEAAARQGDRDAGRASLLALQGMSQGGIHDVLGGGFHRYSVDERWAVPHFEKMLYDNALLTRTFLSAYQRTHEPWLREVVVNVLAYVAREMTTADGVFCASQDADSEGEEGTFFVWTPAQVEHVLGAKDAALACALWGITPGGNFEHGKSVLCHQTTPAKAARALGLELDEVLRLQPLLRQRLWENRETRVKPARDDKVITSWNALMVCALADAACTLEDPAYLILARRALDFILNSMRTPWGGVYRIHAQGTARIEGLLEDHAALAVACCQVHRAGGGTAYLHQAATLCDHILSRFLQPNGAGFYATQDQQSDLLVRATAGQDDALPSAAAAAVEALQHVGTLLGRPALCDAAKKVAMAMRPEMDKFPAAHASLVLACQSVWNGAATVLVVGPDSQALLQHARAHTQPHVMLSHLDEDGAVLDPLLTAHKVAPTTGAAAYVCWGQTCQAPAHNPVELDAALAQGLAGVG